VATDERKSEYSLSLEDWDYSSVSVVLLLPRRYRAWSESLLALGVSGLILLVSEVHRRGLIRFMSPHIPAF